MYAHDSVRNQLNQRTCCRIKPHIETNTWLRVSLMRGWTAEPASPWRCRAFAISFGRHATVFSVIYTLLETGASICRRNHVRQIIATVTSKQSYCRWEQDGYTQCPLCITSPLVIQELETGECLCAEPPTTLSEQTDKRGSRSEIVDPGSSMSKAWNLDSTNGSAFKSVGCEHIIESRQQIELFFKRNQRSALPDFVIKDPLIDKKAKLSRVVAHRPGILKNDEKTDQ